MRKRIYSIADRAAWACEWFNMTGEPSRLEAVLAKALLHEPERCELCGDVEQHRTSYGRLKFLSRDHDHRTGKRRGLQCPFCNTGIGMLADDPELLRRAAAISNTIDGARVTGLNPACATAGSLLHFAIARFLAQA